MSFDFSDSAITIRSEISKALRKEWSFLAAPGTWWSGEERVAIAAEARRAMAGEPSGDELPSAVAGVVRTVAADSPLITAQWVADLEAEGIDPPSYVEIIGVVSRLSSADLFHIALGMSLEPLPSPQSGEPSRRRPPTDVVVGKSFVPMVRQVSIPQTLSLVPAETVAWQELSDVMYMTLQDMGDPDFRHALHRTQMELVAARTSQINECFY
jgi:alkylhydroperoxidase family enzyme